MTIEELKNRLQHIQETLTTRRQEAILLAQNLDQINKSISQLEGNYNECNFYLHTLSNQQAEQKDEQANDESAQEAA